MENYFSFSNPLYWIDFIIITFLVYLLYKNMSNILGWFGELWTKLELNKLPKDKYIVINDIFIKVNDSTHQIDHLVISKYGIFCIESKQYNGYITGNKYDKNWVRHIGKNKYYYTNPIRQNYGHIKALSELLKLDEKKIFNIVCIPSKAKLKIEHDGELVRNYNIKDRILSFNEVIINNIDDYIKIINDNNIKDKKIKKEHIDNIKNNIINKRNNRCPKCGGNLVEKNGKYGKFKGCSNYPKCKFTLKENENIK